MIKGIIGLVVAIVVILAIGYLALSTGVLQKAANAAGQTILAVQITDPPTVPPGTQALVVSYSSVQVHSSGGGNQSGWVDAQGSGTVNLLQLNSSSKTMAYALVATNTSIDLVRFNVTSVSIMVNNTNYNVEVPNNQINVAISSDQKVNSSSSAVLVDLFPTVNAQANSSATTYVFVPAARAIVINTNSSISINANIGSVTSIASNIKAKLGLNASI